MLMYCKRCGRIIQDSDKCDICKSTTYKVPEKYWSNGHDFLLNTKLEDQFYEECVKSSPEFNQRLFDNRDSIKRQKDAEYRQTMAIGNAILEGADPKIAFQTGGQNLPKCPTCGSLKVRKISTGERVASVGFFGLFSKKINKSFKCDNCGYMW